MIVSNATSSLKAHPERPVGNGDSSSSTAERFSLDGPTRPLDPLFHAYRRDLADIALAGQVLAPHYARPVIRGIGAQSTFLRAAPDAEAEALNELLPGETFAVLEYTGGWAWGYALADHMVGYVEAIELAGPLEATHIVCEKCAPVAADNGVCSPVLASLPMGARLHGEERGACLATEYGCVALSHLRRISEHDEDPVIVAERLIGTPHKAGGRSFHGIDSGGLIQLSLSLCGLPSPRLPAQQRELGELLAPDAPARRGDLILFDGQAALMVDDLMMIHACPVAGKVTVEPLSLRRDKVVERRRLPL